MFHPIDINLNAIRFDDQPATIVQAGPMAARAFRYSTGVEALTVKTPRSEVTVLPFKGQQIWRAAFDGRELAMKSMFDEPQATTDYLATYGAFLIHCGTSAMGGPTAADTHPLHGEIPNAHFQSANLQVGEDASGPYLTVAGDCLQARGFAYHYRFHAEITFRPEVSHLDVAVTVENLRPVPMELMYLSHANFRPVDGARLLDTADDSAIAIRQNARPGLQASEAQLRLMADWIADPKRHREIVPGRRIDPEAVMMLECRADADGWAHGMQVHPDGQADFISYRPSELPYAVRWISRLGDQDALGLILPATAGVDGYIAEKAKGRLVMVGPGSTYSCRYRCGTLDAAGAQVLAKRIEAVRHGPR
jgi:Domain of unknown function (DUF4432)